MKKTLVVTAVFLLGFPFPGLTQEHEGHHGTAQTEQGKHGRQSMGEHDMSMGMHGMLGAYPMTREASGTSWQPEGAPMEGIHLMRGDWMLMTHGLATLIYDNQGGERGNREVVSTNMLMGMAQRPLGPGTFGARGMFSLEPLTVGRKGYPLLLQSGETDNGKTPLIDRQHPHDLFMELALTYSVSVGSDSSAFAYVGWPGEPALGPPTFMHRFSGTDNPEAPITHHWLDSTHITHGVTTLGYIWKKVKLEGSLFTGREPDEDRWDLEKPRFDSFAGRFSYNPNPHWAFQASYGHIDSPEQLEPEQDTNRFTISASYHHRWDRTHWQTTAAWGRNRNDPGRDLDGFLVESLVNFNKTHIVFGRAETVEKSELFFEADPLHGKSFTVHKVSLGYIYDFPEQHQVQWGLGGLGSLHFLPERLEEAYEETPFSFMLFIRAKL
ncbi:MAG: hypothetical protein HYY57_03755 [Candidatus Omnitrophica bacterium]|nr:hypothetical protein [Candidatus Omnitrophota bacterium]